MNIKKVSVSRKFNLGNYESLDMSMEAELSENDNPLEMFGVLRDNIEMEFVNMKKRVPIEAPTPQPTPVVTEPPKPQIHHVKRTVEDVRLSFPQELADRLTFEQSSGYIKVKPKQFLGGDNFGKITGAIRGMGGEYISAGRDSHWRIPQ